MVASDKTGLMVEVLRKELDKFVAIKEKFVDEFSLEDFEYIDEVRIGQWRFSFVTMAHLSLRAGGTNWSAVAQVTRRGGSSPPLSSLFRDICCDPIKAAVSKVSCCPLMACSASGCAEFRVGRPAFIVLDKLLEHSY